MTRTRSIAIAAAITAILVGGVAFEVVTTQPVRGAMRTCSELFTIANRPDLTDAERLDCGAIALLGPLSPEPIRSPSPPKEESSAFRATSTRTSKPGARAPTSGSARRTGSARSTSSSSKTAAGDLTARSRSSGDRVRSYEPRSLPIPLMTEHGSPGVEGPAQLKVNMPVDSAVI